MEQIFTNNPQSVISALKNVSFFITIKSHFTAYERNFHKPVSHQYIHACIVSTHTCKHW